jgi:hypothetical protein
MSWFRHVIESQDTDSYYATVSPEQFYELRFTQTIPKHTVVSKRLPSSRIYNENGIMVSVAMPKNSLMKTKAGMKVREDTKSEVVLLAGAIISPKELIEKYKRLTKSFESGLDSFKRKSNINDFLPQVSNKSMVYKIGSFDDNEVELLNFGEVDEVYEKLSIAQINISSSSKIRTGRAYEMSDAMKFEDIMSTARQNNVPFDTTKFQFLVQKAGLKPNNNKKISWCECYMEICPDAKALHERISKFNDLQWVRHTLANHR